MRTPLYDPNARRKTISVTINSDLAVKATALGINLSRTAETAIAAAFTQLERERAKAELEEAVRITDEYVAKYGHPFEEWVAQFMPEAGDDEDAA